MVTSWHRKQRLNLSRFQLFQSYVRIWLCYRLADKYQLSTRQCAQAAVTSNMRSCIFTWHRLDSLVHMKISLSAYLLCNNLHPFIDSQCIPTILNYSSRIMHHLTGTIFYRICLRNFCGDISGEHLCDVVKGSIHMQNLARTHINKQWRVRIWVKNFLQIFSDYL